MQEMLPQLHRVLDEFPEHLISWQEASAEFFQ